MLLKEVFQENGFPENVIDRYYQLYLNRIHKLKGKVTVVEKKPLQSVLPYLGTISM